MKRARIQEDNLFFLDKINYIGEREIKSLRSKIEPEYQADFDAMKDVDKRRLTLLANLTEKELKSIRELSDKHKGKLIGIHDVRNCLFALISLTGNKKYGEHFN